MRYYYSICLLLLLLLSACGGIENEKIDIQNETSTNKLIVPPCLK